MPIEAVPEIKGVRFFLERKMPMEDEALIVREDYPSAVYAARPFPPNEQAHRLDVIREELGTLIKTHATRFDRGNITAQHFILKESSQTIFGRLYRRIVKRRVVFFDHKK